MNMRRPQIHKPGEAGFSLVEMAIVLVIIGLIVSAIAVGRTTMLKAEAVKAYQQYLNPWIQSAIHTSSTTDTVGWGTGNGNIPTTFNYGGGVISQTSVTRNAGVLTISFTLTGAADNAQTELETVFRQSLNTVADAAVSGLTATFTIPSYN
ncbi:MAG: prepilin-type N-terminal cleavage/methylation domain-containing protein [Magnetococcales bacterium]|nr:prepilin-type N-terminal cleavage/methylation domain-containing protein [Magnetococcales bacterium]